MSNIVSTKISKPTISSWQELTIVPVTSKGQVGKPSGSKGKYNLVITLGKPGLIFTSNEIKPAHDLDGDSYIRTRYPNTDPIKAINTLRFKFGNDRQCGLFFNIRVNNDGFLGNIEMNDLEANNFKDAFVLAHKGVAPALSLLSYSLDTPLFIKKVDITEQETGTIRYIALSEEVEKPLNIPKDIGFKHFEAGLLAMYREAINSISSPFYQLFCFYKIIEGVYAIRPKKKEAGVDPKRPVEVIPEGYIHSGKKFGEVRQIIEKQFRDTIAHFSITEDGSLKTSPDDLENWYDCLLILPDLRYVARKMIETELNI